MSEAETPTDAAQESPPTVPAESTSERPAATKPAAVTRELPDVEAIGDWVAGGDLPSLAALFQMPTGAPLPLAKFDALGMQIKKQELLPQHWQVIADHRVPDDSLFDGLAEAGRLRLTYRDQELSRRRLGNLKLAWRELGAKQPSLWSVPDLLAAMRRLLDRKVDFDVYELLCAVRDVWRGMTLPHGREQLEILWACLAFIREKTKK
jgi:hypothetical protein